MFPCFETFTVEEYDKAAGSAATKTACSADIWEDRVLQRAAVPSMD